jgi:hypothetical protein
MTMTHSSRETMGSMAATLKMPYTLTPGRATGIFLAALAQQQILGSRCTACSTVRVPAQDVCPDCGGESPEIVRVPETGVLEAWTQTDQGVIALVRLDGTDISLLHRLVSADGAEMGGRVSAVWNDERTGAIVDISGFAVAPNAAVGTVSAIDLATIEPIELMNYTMQLDYQHAYGHYYGTLFDGVKNDRRIRGVRCPSCRNVLVPPRPYCDACFVPTADWMDVPDTGVVQACSVVHIEFMGQRVPPPYVYAEIVLDGTATRLIHTVGGLSAESAREGGVRPGSRVQAVWSDRTTGSLSDIEYFRVLGEGE